MIGCKRYCCVRHLHVHFSSQRFTSNCFPCFAFGPGGSTFSWLHVLGLCFLNGAPPPAWGLQECLREVNLMEISINSSILNIFESQLSTKRFFNNNGKKELIKSSFHIDKFIYFWFSVDSPVWNLPPKARTMLTSVSEALVALSKKVVCSRTCQSADLSLNLTIKRWTFE
jgi:hypothetical protein